MMNSYKHLFPYKVLFMCLIAFSVNAKDNPPRPADKLLLEFEQLIQGEFDNYNQVNFETNGFLDKADVPSEAHARLYKKVVKIDAPSLGSSVLYEQTHSGGRDKPIYRKTISIISPNYDSNTLSVQNYKLKDDLDVLSHQQSLTVSQLQSLGAKCDSVYSKLGDSFVGTIDKSVCQVPSKHGGTVNIGGDFVVSESGYWHLEAGYSSKTGKMIFGRKDNNHYKLLRARPFKCWAVFKTDKLKENGEPKWDFFSNIKLHSQGDIAQFTTTDTEPKHYFMRLKETRFPAGKRPDVFEIFVHDNSEKAKTDYKQALSYTWANVDASRLGINLRWMQTSCHEIK